jgi:hypothetical protein
MKNSKHYPGIGPSTLGVAVGVDRNALFRFYVVNIARALLKLRKERSNGTWEAVKVQEVYVRFQKE